MGLSKINELRKTRGITLDELSVLSGVPVSTVKKISAGITANPSLDTVKAIVYAMNFRLDDLDDSPNPQKFSIDEQVHIEKFRSLDKYGKKVVTSILDIEAERITDAQKKLDYVPDPQTHELVLVNTPELKKYKDELNADILRAVTAVESTNSSKGIG